MLRNFIGNKLLQLFFYFPLTKRIALAIYLWLHRVTYVSPLVIFHLTLREAQSVALRAHNLRFLPRSRSVWAISSPTQYPWSACSSRVYPKESCAEPVANIREERAISGNLSAACAEKKRRETSGRAVEVNEPGRNRPLPPSRGFRVARRIIGNRT